MHKQVQQAGELELMPIDLVEFNSAGHVLLIANSEQIAVISPQLGDLKITSTQQPPTNIEGWLGNFTVELANTTIKVDLILDLSLQPVLVTPVSPLGYFSPKANKQALAEALQQLPDLVGTFDKPRYFDYKASICAHSRRQISGCTQCIDACPADAIISVADEVSVNPSLCQGCGSCTAVCPSGAMTYALPSLDISLNRLRAMVKTYCSLSKAPAHLVIHDADTAQQLIDSMADSLADNIITFSIEEIAALAMPFWLSALAYGVTCVTVWNVDQNSDHDWQALQQEINKTNQLLTGLAYDNDIINFYSGNSIAELNKHIDSANKMPAIEPALFAGIDDKRRVISLALQHLHQHAADPIEVLALDDNAAFGRLNIDTKACTLCHSCVSVCPAGAVLDGNDVPQLNFIEDLCLQCGLCETACPEDAISLVPQYVFDRQQARKVELLHEEEIFHCISCQKGFATKKMIDTISEKLKGHAMFQGEALNRLKMCEDCRVKAMF